MGDTIDQVAQCLLKGGIQIEFAGMNNSGTWQMGAVQLESKLPEKLYLRDAALFNAA